MTDHPENRLKDSASPYLRSAAHQPIDWHEWGDAAFARARSEDKPILLDIGAVWCHWCHVIDRESYENVEIAKIINEHFIAVKVDRDERPEAAVARPSTGLPSKMQFLRCLGPADLGTILSRPGCLRLQCHRVDTAAVG